MKNLVKAIILTSVLFLTLISVKAGYEHFSLPQSAPKIDFFSGGIECSDAVKRVGVLILSDLHSKDEKTFKLDQKSISEMVSSNLDEYFKEVAISKYSEHPEKYKFVFLDFPLSPMATSLERQIPQDRDTFWIVLVVRNTEVLGRPAALFSFGKYRNVDSKYFPVSLLRAMSSEYVMFLDQGEGKIKDEFSLEFIKNSCGVRVIG